MIASIKVITILFLSLFCACNWGYHRRHAPKSELVCTHFHNATDAGEKSVTTFQGVMRIAKYGEEPSPASSVLIYLKQKDPIYESVYTTSTDDSGRFHLNVPAGTYRMETCKNGLTTLIGRIHVGPNAEAEALDLTTSYDVKD